MDIQVEIVAIGTYVCITAENGAKQYVVTQTTTYQEQVGETAQFTTRVRLLEVSGEGDDLGNEPITVDQDEITYI